MNGYWFYNSSYMGGHWVNEESTDSGYWEYDPYDYSIGNWNNMDWSSWGTWSTDSEDSTVRHIVDTSSDGTYGTVYDEDDTWIALWYLN
jgi:hypothetical protein